MSPKTTRMALADTLDDLTEENFLKFCSRLLDEPAVRRNQVEGKSRLQMVDVLVSRFTEPGAVRVAVKLLGQIQCNEEAGRLATATSGGQ